MTLCEIKFMTLCNCWQRLALFCRCLCLSLAAASFSPFFWPFFGCFLIFAPFAQKVGRHCCRWQSAQEKEMPQQQHELWQQHEAAWILPHSCCHTAATSAATAAPAFGTFGRLQLNTRCFSGIVYIVNERLLHIEQERERWRERERGREAVWEDFIF